MKILEAVSLKPYNTFGVDVAARYYTEVQHISALKNVLSLPQYREVPKLILGGGSNFLFTQDFPGLVIKVNIQGIEVTEENDDFVEVKVGGGMNWHQFVLHCISSGWAGVENLSLIPGTVGAAPIQNIGAYGVELCDVFYSLEAIEISSGQLRIFHHQDCCFGYRSSVFKTKLKGQLIIVSVTFRLLKHPQLNLKYGALQEALSLRDPAEISLKEVSQAVINIRKKKLPDPSKIGNAGSFFKNPIIPLAHYNALQNKFPTIPCYPTENPEQVKVPAGWCIEQCGWKGYREGDVGVYPHQALVLVNFGHATGSDIHRLALTIQKSVAEKFQISLEPEVNIF